MTNFTTHIIALSLMLWSISITTGQLTAQTVANFDEMELEPETYWNGSDGSGGFVSGYLFFPNYFTWWTDELYSWSGFSLSSTTDNETPGIGNQYSVVTGGGYEGNTNYAVAYVSDPLTFANSLFLIPKGPAKGGSLKDMVVSNTTYAALAMLNGDEFSKKFGGEDGNDPDWFLLTLVGWRHGEALEDQKVEFYLADYRFEDSRKNYIVDTWERIPLDGIGATDSLELRLSSSDVGQWGMNTPALICIGQITTMDDGNTTQSPWISQVQDAVIYPNPFLNGVSVSIDGTAGKGGITYRVTDSAGRFMQSGHLPQEQPIDLSSLPSGIYLLSLEGEQYRHTKRIIKQ